MVCLWTSSPKCQFDSLDVFLLPNHVVDIVSKGNTHPVGFPGRPSDTAIDSSAVSQKKLVPNSPDLWNHGNPKHGSQMALECIRNAARY